MKHLIFLLFALILFSKCGSDRKFTVLVVDDNKKNHFHWYYHSLITNYSPDHVEFIDTNCEEVLIYKGRNVTNVSFVSDTVVIECMKCNTIYLDSTFRYPIILKDSNNFKGQIDYRESIGNISKSFSCTP